LYIKTTLDNGLRVITASMPHTRSVCICIYVGVGARYEPDVRAGISHFIEHLNFKGTAAHPTSRELSEVIEGIGGIVNGGTDKEFTMYWSKVPQSRFTLALDLLADMLLNSRLDPADIDSERNIIYEEINMVKDSPSQRVDMIIDELLWPGHPLGRDIAGSRRSVQGISRDAMLEYISRNYLPANTVVAVAGAVTHEETLAAVERAMGGWENHRKLPRFKPFVPKEFPRVRVETRETEQVHLCLGLPGIPVNHPQRFPLDLLNVVLGEGMSSRLFAEVRDRLGLAYSVSSYVDHFQDTGAISIYAGIDPKKLPQAVTAILEQVAKMQETIPDTEITKAKELSKGQLLLRLEDSRSVAGWCGGQEILTGKILTIDEVTAAIDAITATEIRQAAKDFLISSQLRLALVGPVSRDAPLEHLLKM
jgi:predicted Zn-dependent peptidase